MSGKEITTLPTSRVVRVSMLDKDAANSLEEHESKFTRKDVPFPRNIESPFNTTSAFAPSMVTIPKERTSVGLKPTDVSRFAVWLNVNGSIQYSFLETEADWTTPQSPKFATKTIVSPPVAVRFSNEIYLSWVEKERGVQLAKIGGREATTVAPYAVGMKNGLAMAVDQGNKRIVLAWCEEGSIQLSTVNAADKISAPVCVVDHQGPFSMDVRRGRIFILTGGKDVTMHILDAEKLTQIEVIETSYKSQGAIRLVVVGEARIRCVLAWADAKSNLNMRILDGLTDGDLDPTMVTTFKEISVKSAPSITFDEETRTIHVAWINSHNTISVAQTMLGEWPTDLLALSPFIFNTQDTGNWYIQLGIPPGQPAPVPSFQAFISTPGSNAPTLYGFPANITMYAPTIPTSWFIQVQYKTGIPWRNSPLATYDTTQNRWDFYCQTTATGYYCQVSIFNN